MKKLIGAILILMALSGCDGKSSNADPKYAGVDEIIEKMVKRMNEVPQYKNETAQFKVERSSMIFSIDMEGATLKFKDLSEFKGVQKNCAKEEIIKSFGDYAGEPENKQKIDELMAFAPFLCENGVYKVEKYEEQRKILEAYATQKFKDEFLEK